MNELSNIVLKFNKKSIPRIYKSLLQKNAPTDQLTVLKHSIVDLSENKVYNLTFPLDFDGKDLESVITSVEKWQTTDRTSDIAIGDDKFIQWKEANWSTEPNHNIDELIQPIIGLLKKLATVCSVECCGIQAFDFTPQAITEAAKDNPTKWDEELDIVIKHLDSVEKKVVISSKLNQLFEKSVFIELLHHLQANVKPSLP